VSAQPRTYLVLACDQRLAGDCEELFHDEDSALILGDTIEDLRQRARDDGYENDRWIVYEGTDACPACTMALASGPHTFTPYVAHESVCGVCMKWATDGPHGLDVTPGQTEIPAQDVHHGDPNAICVLCLSGEHKRVA
jgi:hypothetical protein